MLRFETTLKKYEAVNKCLAEIRPEIEFRLVVCDDALSELGFVSSPLCIAEMDLSDDEFDALMDDLIQYEIDAFNQPSELTYEQTLKTPEYRRYQKYGWLWDYFSHVQMLD